NDSILLVRIGDGPESEAEIEILEAALRCDLDGLAGRQRVETSQGFSHQGSALAGSPHIRRGDNSSNGSFIVAHSRLENARVRHECSPARALLPTEQMPGVRIASVGVGVRAVLLDYENRFAKPH